MALPVLGTLPKSGIKITRWSVVGMEAMYAKMFDPPTSSPATTDALAPTNPVPEVMAAAGLATAPPAPHVVVRSLLHALTIPTWDGAKLLKFFTIGDSTIPSAAGGTYPGPTLRMPRGVVFNAQTTGAGPPPHTIHWHGTEPTPINDGVGHCSMEIGAYRYQWQPNFMGFYFYHCHRNTMQHFEFGLYGATVFEAPDTYFATQVDPSIPIGHSRDGKRRLACNLANFPQFPGFIGGLLTDPDPWTGDPRLKFATNPHAMTVPFDVEALWVLDDRDSVWSDLGGNARQTFPTHGSQPGINDVFTNTPFAFNDFNADYWFVTGVPVPAHKGGTAAIPAGLVIPPALNSGISGTQISIEAKVGDTICVRCLPASYNSVRVTFPVNVVVTAWDGRALGVPPYGHNEAYLIPAGTPINTSTARRIEVLIRETSPFNGTVKCEFINNRGQNVVVGVTDYTEVLLTALIPLNIGGNAIAPPGFTVSGTVLDQVGAPAKGVNVTIASLTLGGAATQTVQTDGKGTYTFPDITNGSYTVTPTLAGHVFAAPSAQVTVSDQIPTVPNFTMSIATFDPNSYSINEALDSLRSIVGSKTPTPTEKFRFDVAPIFNGIPAPDGVIDIRDSLNILRMVVGLNPV
jgi:hypothetical protein